MKRIVTLLAAAGLALGTAACSGGGLSRQAACVQVRAAYANSDAWSGGGESDTQFASDLSAIHTSDGSLQPLLDSAAAAQQKVADAESQYESSAQITSLEGDANGPEQDLYDACAP
jgi:hypothetical protein